MKNKLCKGAHLNERKVREILLLFSEDLNATQISNITGVSRVTINHYTRLIRTLLAAFCEEQNPLVRSHTFIPYTGGLIHEQAEAVLDSKYPHVFGIYRQDNKLFVNMLNPEQAEQVMLSRLRKQLNGHMNGLHATTMNGHSSNGSNGQSHSQLADVFEAFIDLKGWRLIRGDKITSAQNGSRPQLDEIDQFWSLVLSRLAKFRGLSASTVYLHLKECEFRYNYRSAGIHEVLTQIIQQRPLHLSRPVKV